MPKHQRSLIIRLALVLLTTACGAPVNISQEGVTPIVVYPPTAPPLIVQANPAADEVATPVMFVTAVAFATVIPPTATALPPASATPRPAQPTAAPVTPAATATPHAPAPTPTIALASLPTAPPVAAKASPTAVNLRLLPTAPPVNLKEVVAALPPTPTPVQGQFPKVVVGFENAVGGPSGNTVPAMRNNLLAQSNAARMAAGLPPLQLSPVLQLAAQHHADECAELRVCGHTGADGSNTRQRLQRVGYMSDAVGENWAWARSVPAAWDMWFTQEFPEGPHRNNILSRFYREVGFGIAAANGGFYFITNFGGSYR